MEHLGHHQNIFETKVKSRTHQGERIEEIIYWCQMSDKMRKHTNMSNLVNTCYNETHFNNIVTQILKAKNTTTQDNANYFNVPCSYKKGK